MKRGTLLGLGVLVLLAVSTVFVLQRPGEFSTAGVSGEPLVSYDSTAIDRMEITMQATHIVLEKQGGKWMIVEPIKYAADERAVGEAVGSGKSLLISSTVSTNPEKQHLFQVDSSSGTLVRLFDRGTEKAAFRVGKAGSSFMDTYVRLEGSNEVHLVQGLITSTYNRQPNNWRDRHIFKTDQESITEVRFQFRDTTFTLAFHDSVWRIGTDSTVPTTVTSFLSSLASFQTDEFVDSTPTPIPPLTGVIEVAGIQIRFYHIKDTSKYYVQTSASPQWYEVQQWRVNQVLKRKKEFLPGAAT